MIGEEKHGKIGAHVENVVHVLVLKLVKKLNKTRLVNKHGHS